MDTISSMGKRVLSGSRTGSARQQRSLSLSSTSSTAGSPRGSIDSPVPLMPSHLRNRKRMSSPVVPSRRAASIAAGSIQGDKRSRVSIWPEWSDGDVNGEKWEAQHKQGRDKSKSPAPQQLFEDPEGKIELPPSLKVDSWRRPHEYLGTDKQPVIVEPEGYLKFDLLTANEHIHHSELMRWITSQITALWSVCTVQNPNPEGASDPQLGEDGELLHQWRPWESIYAINKITKGPNVPLYNPYGKYVVKLYWMGCWRKIVIDDQLPFDEAGRLLLPATTLQTELWPLLLSKALIKIASLDYNGGQSSCEFGDFSVIHSLMGWIPETIPLQYGHLAEIWNLLKDAMKEWKLPEPEAEKGPDGEEQKDAAAQEPPKEEKPEKDAKDVKNEKVDSKAGKDSKKESKGKEDKKDKKDKDKKDDKHKDKNIPQEEIPIPEHPEMVVFASYSGPPKFPVRVSVLAEMADASERLRQAGLSHMFPHPVLLTQTRSCPLEPPPPPEVIPAWKLIRPRKKKTTPSDEPVEEPEPPKPIQCVEISSPFINYKVSPVPIPTDTHRPKSALERGGTRPPTRTASVAAIEETDENVPEPEPEPKPKEEPKTPEPEEPKQETVEAEPVSKSGSSKPGSPKKRGVQRTKSSETKERAKSSQEQEPPAPARSPDRRKSVAPGRDRSDSKSSTDSKTKDGRSDVLKNKAPSHPQPAPDISQPLPEEGAEEGEAQEGEPPAAEEPCEPEVITKPAQDIWMDYDIFCKCFRNLIIFHKPNTYKCNQKHSDMKNIVTAGNKEKKSAPPTATSVVDDKAPNYLFVDNLDPSEIVVSFTSLSRWNEPPPPPLKEEKSHSTIKAGKDKGDQKTDATLTESSSVVDVSGTSERSPEPPPQQGLLVAEPYSWKSLVTGQPIMRIRSTGTRAAVLSLPAGRHVIRFQMSGPLGYHVHLCSSVPFVFGDEEKVMAELTQESCRFKDNALQVIKTMGKCISVLNDTEAFLQAYEEFTDCHCPYRKDKRMSKQYHYKLFLESWYGTLKKALAEHASLLTGEMAFAWRAFFFDCTTRNPLGIPMGGSRPATAINSHRGSARHEKKKRDQPEPKLDHWINREITPEEHVAAVKIQKGWRGGWVRKIKMARTAGTAENVKVQEQLQKSWGVLEPKAEEHGRALFRTMFKADPELMTKYPFHKDEWNKISYADYSGSHPDQGSGTWFVVFREIFYVSEEMLCVPKLYVPIPTCMLRVVNNDAGEEVPRVFQKVAPFVYKKNRRGYTFMAEARTLDQSLQPGRWRMRLIGSLSPLPAPSKNEVNSSFHTRELRDYYVPNPRNCILRYSVKVQEDHLVTLQLATSKPDVYVKLAVLDHEQEVCSASGKGHVVLPAFLFLKDAGTEEDGKRSSSRASTKGAKVHTTSSQGAAGKAKRAQSPGGRVSRSSSRKSLGSLADEEEADTKPHKYVIQATVLRNSWPLSESSWAFVQVLKEQEKNELKVANRDRAQSPARNEKSQGASKAAPKGKGKDKGAKDKSSRPPSQQFDFSKPNWLLRVVSDGSAADDIDVKRDTERADEIRAIKRAWEDAEPGRAAKAMQSRLRYLKESMIRVKDDEPEEKPAEGAESASQVAAPEPSGSPHPGIDAAESEGILTLEPPRPPTPKEKLQELDLTPFLRRTSEPPRLKDEAETQRQLDAKQREFQEYKAQREEVERRRELDRQQRNLAKIQQLQMCEDMQAALDAAREAINKPREAFRQKFLEAERKRLEEIAAQEAALQAEANKSAPSPKGRKSAKGKKSPGGGKKKK